MKLLNTNGQTYSVQPIDYVKTNDQVHGKSKGHLLARKLIKECFPVEWILEEVPVRVAKQVLYADFLLKSRQIVVEVQGQQHDKFTPFFHETESDFKESKIRDMKKKDWCETNQFTLIELPYPPDEQIWIKLLNQL
jgi:hypothetical protein